MGAWADHVPPLQVMTDAIEAVVARGVRRPAYEADRWTEQMLLRRFEALGLDDVRAEPVDVVRWEEGPASLVVGDGPSALVLHGFPLPHTAPGEVHGPLVAITPGGAAPGDDIRAAWEAGPGQGSTGAPVAGAVAVQRQDLPAVPNATLLDMAVDSFDPEGHFGRSSHVIPFTVDVHDVTAAAQAGGAIGFVGLLGAHFWDTDRYYLPYDGRDRPLPSLWLRPSAGARLSERMAAGPCTATLRATSTSTRATTSNIVGTLPGRSDHWVVIGTHHDSPWASAVEDASGIALVLAQAQLWARVPAAKRPHNLLFLVNGAHMFGGAGVLGFMAAHRAFLDQVVLAVHLEHVAAACEVADGALVPRPEPEDRWWFVSEHPELQATVAAALRAESLGRSLLFRPETFMAHPPTDGGPFHLAGVPLVNFLPAPRYLFDDGDTPAMVHRPSLLPVTRAVARIVSGTTGMTPATFRARTV